MHLELLDPSDPCHLAATVDVWNAGCGEALRITPRFAEFNTQLATGALQTGYLAVETGQFVGFALASALPGNPLVSPPDFGWVDAIAVLPALQRRGIGSALLHAAEQWLTERGCTRTRLGASLRPFAPGYPLELAKVDFFHFHGYAGRAGGETTWDVARDLGDYQPRYLSQVGDSFHVTAGVESSAPATPAIAPAQDGDEDALRAFFVREFPNRWRFEYEELVRIGGRMSDWMILRTPRGVDGFARLTLEDSKLPVERFYLHRLPRPWAQLGPIGVSADLRGRGYGGLLLDASLVHLRDAGVRGCVIDWTSLLDFYSKFGFTPYREYAMLVKTLTAHAN